MISQVLNSVIPIAQTLQGVSYSKISMTLNLPEKLSIQYIDISSVKEILEIITPYSQNFFGISNLLELDFNSIRIDNLQIQIN